jgi:hypothetical protein
MGMARISSPDRLPSSVLRALSAIEYIFWNVLEGLAPLPKTASISFFLSTDLAIARSARPMYRFHAAFSPLPCASTSMSMMRAITVEV